MLRCIICWSVERSKDYCYENIKAEQRIGTKDLFELTPRIGRTNDIVYYMNFFKCKTVSNGF